MSQSGDLTDAESWERAWKRSRGIPTASWLKKRLVEDHHTVLEQFFARASGGTNRTLDVIEVGCAPGKLLAAMASVAPAHRYAGVDFAPAALERTREALSARGLAPTLHLADVRTFEPPHAYDLVVSFGLIEHFDDPRDILRHHVRLVRSGGVVGVTVPNYAHAALQRALDVYSPDTLRTHNLDVMRTAALDRLLADVGLRGIATGQYGGAVMPSARARGGLTGMASKVLATGWNVMFRTLPSRWSPWQGYLWASGTKPD